MHKTTHRGINTIELITPARQSYSRNRFSSRPYEGYVRLYLVHNLGKSYFIPTILVSQKINKYFIPSFFSAPHIAFNINNINSNKNAIHIANFTIDVASPDSFKAIRVFVEISSSDFIRSYHDGSQLYYCRYYPPNNTPLAPHAAGTCEFISPQDIYLHVYHHTNSIAARSIETSKYLRSNKSNISGMNNIPHGNYIYLTTLQKIKTEMDLGRIAMASQGDIIFQTTSNDPEETKFNLTCYIRSISTLGEALKFKLPLEFINPNHLLFHQRLQDNKYYYEYLFPEIIRVSLQEEVNLNFDKEHRFLLNDDKIKSSSYVIESTASSRENIEIPFNEKIHGQVAYIENLGNKNILSFWIENKNTDLFSPRSRNATTHNE